MHARFLLGPAGSGKTFRCLTEAREAVLRSPEGPPLILLAPKQGTYQLEQQLLADSPLSGYTRLRIVSFEALSHFVLDQLQKPSPRILDEEGRLMVLRSLLVNQRQRLKLFRASARLTGFAQHLSLVLRDFQRNRLTAEGIKQLAAQPLLPESLSYKLHDLATLLQEYLDWLKTHQLRDADSLLTAAIEALRESRKSRCPSPKLKVQSQKSEGDQPDLPGFSQISCLAPDDSGTNSSVFHISRLWVDGFAEFSQQELELLAELMPYCAEATLALCLDDLPAHKKSWLSSWSMVRRTFEHCHLALAAVPGLDLAVEVLPRESGTARFSQNPVLQHLERNWADPLPFPAQDCGPGARPSSGATAHDKSRLSMPADILKPTDLPAPEHEPTPLTIPDALRKTLRIAACADPEAEATLAAREILGHVRAGGRFRDISVLVRKLEGYYQPLRRVLSRYDIPFFVDRRESMAHHPLAELTRSALRTVAFGWQHEDWFAALKSGLVRADEKEIDRLENEALARGWKGDVWHQPIRISEPEGTEDAHKRACQAAEELEKVRCQIILPFERLALALARPQNQPTGRQLADALRHLWQDLNAEEQLEQWADGEPSTYESRARDSVHKTVWNQSNAWLKNVELAFPTEALPLREWLPILEAGLGNLSVGTIPPALDQVLIGSIDRSRTPDIKLAVVLGLNESVFPAPPPLSVLLTDTDRLELEKRNVLLGCSARHQLASERFFAYIACTRARDRLVLTYSLQDPGGTPLNPSPFLSCVKRLFPSLQIEAISKKTDWRDSQHFNELVGPLLTMVRPGGEGGHQSGAENQQALTSACAAFSRLPDLVPILEQLSHFRNPGLDETVAPELAAQLYGPVLRTSVSRMEQFAACPFKFFIHSGLRAEERKLFELDAKEQGSFQHDVLALFHEQIQAEGKRWRDITPIEARERISDIARSLLAGYRNGLFEASEQTRFMARVLTESLQDFVETLVEWMRGQYQFDPIKVELPFGQDDSSPPWTVDLDRRHRLELYGRIDRVDLYRTPDTNEALCVVVDYKSSQKQLDPVLMAHGLQLQLLTYLNVLRHWPDSRSMFGSARLKPAGLFYVNLRGKYHQAPNRKEALSETREARKLAYRHSGRFDASALQLLDGRKDAPAGDQFNYRRTAAGRVHKGCREAMATADLYALLDSVESNLRKMGLQIYSGAAQVAPYRKGAVTACDQCDYRSICRLDPWTHRYRVLRNDPRRR